MLPTIPSFLSDLFAGVLATVVFGAWAFLTRLFGPKAGGKILDRLRRFGWLFVADVFLGGTNCQGICMTCPSFSCPTPLSHRCYDHTRRFA